MQKPPDLFLNDAQLPPSLVPFFRTSFSLHADHVNELAVTKDEDIFMYARNNNAFIITKDSDFEQLVLKNGSPPKILLIPYGNVGNTQRKQLLLQKFGAAS